MFGEKDEKSQSCAEQLSGMHACMQAIKNDSAPENNLLPPIDTPHAVLQTHTCRTLTSLLEARRKGHDNHPEQLPKNL
jgi:hypothetical protein